MTHLITKGILTFSLVITGGIASVTAQVDPDSVFTINVPFQFNVRGKTLPAGRYSIRTPDKSGSTSVMEIVPIKANRPTAMFETESVSVDNAPKQSNVIFGKIQGKYYLSEIWEANSTNGVQVEEPEMKGLERESVKMEKQVVRAETSRHHAHSSSKT